MYAIQELEPYLELSKILQVYKESGGREEILHQHIEQIKEKLENQWKIEKVQSEIKAIKELSVETNNALMLLSSNMQFINKSSQEIITHLQPEGSVDAIIEQIVSTCFDHDKKVLITSRYAGIGPAFIHYVVDNYYRIKQLGNSPPTLKCVRKYLNKKFPNAAYNRFPLIVKDQFKHLKTDYESKTNKKAEHKH